MFRQINRFFGFGFGQIDAWVFVYAGGTTICGFGMGMLVMDALRYGPLEIDALVITGMSLTLVGLVLANVGHSVLKKKAAGTIAHQVIDESSRNT